MAASAFVGGKVPWNNDIAWWRCAGSSVDRRQGDRSVHRIWDPRWMPGSCFGAQALPSGTATKHSR